MIPICALVALIVVARDGSGCDRTAARPAPPFVAAQSTLAILPPARMLRILPAAADDAVRGRAV